MSEGLSIQGTLAETTVPDLFRSVIRSGETAVVSLDAIGRNDVIYFNEGRIVFASSTDPDMGLAEVLLRSGELNLQQYNNAMERLVVSRRIGGLLCELGYLQPDELIRAVERQASDIVLNSMSYRTGSYTMRSGNGIVEVHFSGNDSFDLNAQTATGTVDNQAEAYLKPDSHGVKHMASKFTKGLFGTVGSGLAKVELSSYSGTIRILKRD